MKKNLFLSALLIIFILKAFPQSNCSNPLNVSICPSVYFTNQTNFGMLDDAPSNVNYVGEDLVYKIATPANAGKLYLSIVNLTGFTHLSLKSAFCGAFAFSTTNINAGNTNLSFNLVSGGPYYLFVDAPGIITYDISFGVDTPVAYVNTPNTLGNLQFSNNCASPVFAASKPFFQVSYNGVYQTKPMTLSPLFVQGTMCAKIFFQNTTGTMGIKKFNFSFNPLGFSSYSGPAIIPGFYNAGNWIRSTNPNGLSYVFVDSAGLGRGDFTGTPNTCLGYEFCFSIVPVSNVPQLTDVIVDAFSDTYGTGFTGWVYGGCCPTTNPNCHPGIPGGPGAGGISFGFTFDDPGGPLPIELISFNAESDNEVVHLFWSTASEINNDYFTIERSINSFDWKETGRIDGAGNSTKENNYSFYDKPGEDGLYYYRLKQTDFDGHSTLSSIREIRFDKPDELVIRPNPASQYFVLESKDIKSYQYSLYNFLGEMMVIPVKKEANQTFFNTSELIPGLYFLIVKKENKVVHTGKVFIEK
jgi:hypothetical protein